MKLIIWVICIFIYGAINATLAVSGITLGGIPTALLAVGTWFLARFLCKKWDEHNNAVNSSSFGTTLESVSIKCDTPDSNPCTIKSKKSSKWNITFISAIVLSLVSILAIILTIGCFHQHEWTKGSCTTPITCTRCGKTKGTFGHTWSPTTTCGYPKKCIHCGVTEGPVLEHTWLPATCKTPKKCSICGTTEGTPTLEHTWLSATCKTPKKCSICGTTEGTTLEHTWLSATCKTPKKCSICGTTEGTTLEHTWLNVETTDSPAICAVCNYMEPLTLPHNGQVFISADLSRNSKLTIHSSYSDNCYVKLKSASGNDVFSFFVRAGESVTVSVPADYFYVYFSYGEEWYGTKYIFGPNTRYSKDDEFCDFKNYTWEYTLYSSYNGNFSETPVSPEEFQ